MFVVKDSNGSIILQTQSRSEAEQAAKAWNRTALLAAEMDPPIILHPAMVTISSPSTFAVTLSTGETIATVRAYGDASLVAGIWNRTAERDATIPPAVIRASNGYASGESPN